MANPHCHTTVSESEARPYQTEVEIEMTPDSTLRRAVAHALGVLLLLALAASVTAKEPPAEAIELRNLGLAQLENEKPEEAEATFRRLAEAVPDDPIGAANLAIALHRQQRTEEALRTIKSARERQPERVDLLLIEAEIHAWGTLYGERALELLEQAMTLAPNDPEVIYALYRQAEASRSARAEELKELALSQLTLLRPDNLVVLLRSGVSAIESGDRRAATAAWLRVRELLWQPAERLREVAQRELAKLLEALEEGEVANARVPAIRLENLLKSTPMYRSSLVELFTDVRGLPVWSFEDEPAAAFSNDGVAVTFSTTVLDPRQTVGQALLAVDLDDDESADIARVRAPASAGGGATLELRMSKASTALELKVPSASRLLPVDIDNNGALDLVAHGDVATTVFLASEPGRYQRADGGLGLGGTKSTALVAFDFDSEGDLDFVIGEDRGLQFFRNNLAEDLVAVDLEGVSAEIFPETGAQPVGVVAADLDRDEDQDLLVWTNAGLRWLDNLRQGQFRDRTTNGGLASAPTPRALELADLDNDGYRELVLATTQRVVILDNLEGRFRSAFPKALPEIQAVVDLEAFDADNDGHLDLATCSANGIGVFLQRATAWQAAKISDLPEGPCAALAAEDLDADGDLDLVATGSAGLLQLRNDGGNANGWLRLRLRGLTKGNDKNNFFGRGATVELRVGSRYQYREVDEPTTHLGLGKKRRGDNLRVVWANGVPQNRVQPQGNQEIVEEQVLKGSCPFVYTWDGEGISFVTDLLWNAPIGMPVAPGIYAASDPRELVRLDRARPRTTGGREWIDLRITEELWEAAYFDRTRLWVIDHPQGTEVTSSLRVFARIPDGFRFDEPRLIQDLRPLSGAWDGEGRDVLARVQHRDDIYSDGYPVGRYQGVTEKLWATTIELPEAPAEPIRLVLDGWIFPADASLNLAVAQHEALRHHPTTRLEVLTEGGWQVLLDPMGFPAGKTKTMVVDTPRLPPGARRLRIVTSRWLHWDRIAWTTQASDQQAVVIAQLDPASADLRYRGFSKMYREAPNAPHVYDYDRVDVVSPWQPVGGQYTRYGDVAPLLRRVDDQLVVMAPGDEITVQFDVSDLAPPQTGYQRTYLLESFGWDKDFDRNTYEATSAQPLPFGAMEGYPYRGPYPESEELRRYREHWLTRSPSQVPPTEQSPHARLP